MITGATRDDLIPHRLAECAIVSLLSASAQRLPLLLSAALPGGVGNPMHAFDAAGVGLLLAALLSLVGVLIPGVYAARVSRIAALECAGL